MEKVTEIGKRHALLTRPWPEVCWRVSFLSALDAAEDRLRPYENCIMSVSIRENCQCHGRSVTYLPSITAVKTLAERRHRLISAPGLRLRIADLLLFAPTTFQAVTDTLLSHGDLSLLHVLFLHFDIELTLVIALQLIVGHPDEFSCRDVVGHDAEAERLVRLALEVAEQRANLLLVRIRLSAKMFVCRTFNRHRPRQHVRDGLGRAVSQAVVDDAYAGITNLRTRAGKIHLVDIEFALFGVARVGSAAAGFCSWRRFRWRGGGGSSGRR